MSPKRLAGAPVPGERVRLARRSRRLAANMVARELELPGFLEPSCVRRGRQTQRARRTRSPESRIPDCDHRDPPL